MNYAGKKITAIYVGDEAGTPVKIWDKDLGILDEELATKTKKILELYQIILDVSRDHSIIDEEYSEVDLIGLI